MFNINDAEITLTLSSSSLFLSWTPSSSSPSPYVCFSWWSVQNTLLLWLRLHFWFESFLPNWSMTSSVKTAKADVFSEPIKSTHLILDIAHFKICCVINYFVSSLYFLIILKIESKLLIACSIQIEEYFIKSSVLNSLKRPSFFIREHLVIFHCHMR